MRLAPDACRRRRVLRGGGVIAYPTEAVWGLGCDPFDEAAVMRLLAIKQRPVDKGLILVAGATRAVRRPARLGRAARAIAPRPCCASWPGPHTWIVPATARVPRWITGAHDGVAVRVSAHPGGRRAVPAFGGPLVSTSANLAGEPPAFTAPNSTRRAGALDGVCDGETGGLRAPTAIRDAATGAELRAG